VAAEVDLGLRGEPPELVLFAAADEEGGLGEVVFRGDRLEDIVRQEVVEGHDGGGVSFKDAACEGVHLVERKLGHDSTVAGAAAGVQELRTGKA